LLAATAATLLLLLLLLDYIGLCGGHVVTTATARSTACFVFNARRCGAIDLLLLKE